MKPVRLDGDGYFPLFRGETRALRAGHVHLPEGEECGEHTTGDYEEILIFLEGRGKVLLGGDAIPVEGGMAFYIPPHTIHSVVADEPLRYVYIVGPAYPRPEDVDWVGIYNRRVASRSNGDRWEGVAELYDEWCRATGYPGPILNRVLSFVDETFRVLEIGPGTGAFTLPLAERVRELVALEPSPAMRAVLQRRLEERGLNNVTVLPVRLEEAEDLGEFDMVLAAFSLGVRDLRAAVERMNLMCKGYCVLVEGDRVEGDGVLAADSLLRERKGVEVGGPLPYIYRVNALYQIGIRPAVEIVGVRADVPWDLYVRHRGAMYGVEVGDELADELERGGLLIERDGRRHLHSRGAYACIWWRPDDRRYTI